MAIRKYIIAYVACVVFLLGSTVLQGDVSLDTEVFRCSDASWPMSALPKGQDGT